MPDPTFLTLDEWGGRVNNIGRAMTLPAVGLWGHHSVTRRTGDPVADFRTLDALGVGGGISYSYVIEDNTVGEGQGTRQGAHTGGTQGCGGSPWGWNSCSFGVCFVGDFHPRDGVVADVLSDQGINSFRWLREKLIREGHLVPGVYPTGGHRDAPGNSTACPGDNIATRLDELRSPFVSQRTEDNGMYVVYSVRADADANNPELEVISAIDGVVRHGNPYTVDGAGNPRTHDVYAVISPADAAAAFGQTGGSSGGASVGPLAVTLTGTAVPA